MLFKIIHTIVSRLLLILFLIIYFIPMAIVFFTPAKYRYDCKLIFYIAYGFYWAVLKCTLVPITYTGKENIPNEPVIYAANHQSSLDIPLVGLLAGVRSQVWLATEWLLRSPLMRIMVPRLAVMVDKSNSFKAMRSLIKIINMTKDKDRDLMIFPEGQRFTDDEVHEFFGGFVILAKKLKRPVVPVYIEGANKVYPPNTFWINWHPIKVIVGKPFLYKEDDTDELFKQRVYDWFVQQVKGAA